MSIPNCVRRTYASEGMLGFYKGLSTNAVRILPGTCVTFVVYVSPHIPERRTRD
jgi:solute carrier family 25 folate transporter 32